MFSGSYNPEDAIFLLKRVHLEPTSLEEKERLIQTGQRHYSEMIGLEQLPSPAYLRVFHQALEHQKERFARHLLILAAQIAQVRPGFITLVSLARAGIPIGVLVARILRCYFQREAIHYTISIVRDRGIDEVALNHILSQHPAHSVAFVDGWTGKGVIARELRHWISRFNTSHGQSLDSGLFAVADLCGEATAATNEDYLIPCSVLGATISGLISRSILNDRVIGPEDFHGCLYYQEFQHADLSHWFIEVMMEAVHLVVRREAWGVRREERPTPHAPRPMTERLTTKWLDYVQRRYKIRDINHIKPGVGEASRVLLRRVPDCLLLRDPASVDVAHLLLLAQEKNVDIIIEPSLPYQAVALIKELN